MSKGHQDEKKGVEAVMRECKELVEQYKRNPHRAGYKDISLEEWPPVDEDEDPPGGEGRGRRSCLFSDDVEEIVIPAGSEEDDSHILPSSDEEVRMPEVGGSRRVSVEEPVGERSGMSSTPRRSSALKERKIRSLKTKEKKEQW